MITGALHAALAADAPLAALLSNFKGGPAIFASLPIPRTARPPYLVIGDAFTDAPWDTLAPALDGYGREFLCDVAAYAPAETGAAVVFQIAERVRRALHDSATIAPAGHRPILCKIVSGPIPAPTDHTLTGRILTARVIIQEALS